MHELGAIQETSSETNLDCINYEIVLYLIKELERYKNNYEPYQNYSLYDCVYYHHDNNFLLFWAIKP